MAKYQLIGLRAGSHGDAANSYARTDRFIAILRGLNGRRVTAEVSEADTKDWPSLRSAIVRYLNKDGVKRIDASEIDDGTDSGDQMPWNHEVPARLDGQDNRQQSDVANARLTATTDRTAGKRFYQRQRGRDVPFSRKSNEDYLRELQEANFDFTPSQRLAANNERIAALQRELEEKRLAMLEQTAELATRRQRDSLLNLTTLGRAITGQNRKN